MSLLKQHQTEINTGKNRADKRSEYEERICKNIESIVKSEKFFKLPLSNLLSIFSKLNFNEIDDIIPFITNYISNTIKYHSNEKETIFLLQLIKTNEKFTFDDIISILLSFTNCDIFKTLKNQYNDIHNDIEFDYEYELKQKNKEIEELKATISTMKNEKQNDQKKVYPRHSCECGTFTFYMPSEDEVVMLNQYKKTIGSKKFNPNKLDNQGMTLLQHVCEDGFFSIVKYLVEDVKVDLEAKDSKGKTAIHYAIHQLELFNYLKEQGAKCPKGLKPKQR